MNLVRGNGATYKEIYGPIALRGESKIVSLASRPFWDHFLFIFAVDRVFSLFPWAIFLFVRFLCGRQMGKTGSSYRFDHIAVGVWCIADAVPFFEDELGGSVPFCFFVFFLF
jgi:hypothetical protein